MNYLNGGLELFAALVIVMQLLSVQGERQEQLFEKYLSATMVCHLLALLLEATRWFLYAQRDQTPLLILSLMAASTVLSLASNACFVYCLIAYFADRITLFQKILPSLRVFFLCSILILVLYGIRHGDRLLMDAMSQGAAQQYGIGYWVGQSMWGLVCVIGVVLILCSRKVLRRHETMALLIYCTFPIFSLLLKLVWNGAQIYLSMTLSLVLIHSVMYREHRRRLQEQEQQLVRSRTAILVGQIQPHFLYNVLNSIYYLCDQNPAKAQQAISDFSDYLRVKLDALQQEGPIGFDEELCHVKTYLALEKMRFDEKLEIAFDIRCSSFCLPALSLQVLVENAVKHGVGKAKNGGTVHVSSWEEPDCYVVCVTDNGVGFDPDESAEDGPPRVGVENAQSRLALLCAGTLVIESQKGSGTRATIRIPKISQK